MIIDLTQTFNGEMPVYPGDPKSELKQISTVANDSFADHRLTTAMHVGTHMDAPMHMIAGGKKISEIGPERFWGRGWLLDARGQAEIDPESLDGVEPGDIVLVLTGWGEKFKEREYFERYPEFTESFARHLAAKKVKAVGSDTPSPDRPPFAVHKILLGQEILIIENLTNLEKLLNQKFEVIALPAKFETDAAPARVIAKTE